MDGSSTAGSLNESSAHHSSTSRCNNKENDKSTFTSEITASETN